MTVLELVKELLNTENLYADVYIRGEYPIDYIESKFGVISLGSNDLDLEIECEWEREHDSY